jgi:epoxyqueuosine reductase
VRWLRNLAVAAGNALRQADDAALRAALKAHLSHSNDVVREHVQWALAQGLSPRFVEHG